jgi:2'-5' RNA ligase
LIVTLALDAASFAYFDRLRRRHFPPARNVIPAHLTLFHHLPGAQREALAALLTERCRRQPPIALHAAGLCFLGRGVAFALASPELSGLRADLAAAWQPWLTAQDRQPFRPHVTIQNKVRPDEARALHDQLSQGFAPFTVLGEGLSLWRYRQGSWESLDGFAFEAA